ncbi:MAG: D-alanyl-D-alanine carboxypeptidase/D-alanyl-D-alanine-endopeptidase [Comamonadaceae bacterium]
MTFRSALMVACCFWSFCAWAQIPASIDAQLTKAKIPRDAAAFLVVEAVSSSIAAKPRLSHRASAAMQAASVMKLATTFAALELLGPSYTWATPVFIDGAIREGVLYGNVYIQGQGDPKLVLERMWLLLRRLQGAGITSIRGDIVLDRSAFDVPESDPGAFDGEPLRPYNASPDALLLNYKSVVMTFTPAPGSNVAYVQYDPPLAGVQTQDTVVLSTTACNDYRATLKPDFSDPLRIRFTGSYPLSCGERVWPVAYADPTNFAPRAVQGLWGSVGGKLSGSVRFGNVPARLALEKPLFEVRSAPLAEIIRDINKFSNNVMAQQLFLTLGRDSNGSVGSFPASRFVIQRWWQERISQDEPLNLDNGSGLSRTERISAQALGRLLQSAYRSPLMPELIASLPISGIDGTMKRSKSNSQGSAHLKTGSMNGVTAIAGFVHATSGKHYVLVALVNHPNAPAARAAFDALVDWTAQDN